jgi:CxxC-x17-CxxC domain-containing protein
MSERITTEVKCNDCGKITSVPFKPTAGKPIYCRECLPKHRTRKIETGKRMDTNYQNDDREKQAWSRRRENWK